MYRNQAGGKNKPKHHTQKEKAQEQSPSRTGGPRHHMLTLLFDIFTLLESARLPLAGTGGVSIYFKQNKKGREARVDQTMSKRGAAAGAAPPTSTGKKKNHYTPSPWHRAYRKCGENPYRPCPRRSCLLPNPKN